MLLFDFILLAQQCAPQVSLSTMAAIVRTESGFNPYAIGVAHGQLARQPASAAEATATANALERGGWNFSVGLAQVNRSNWSAYGLNERSAFDPCRNLAAAAGILQRCFELARRTYTHASVDFQSELHLSLSCYASGDFSTGYRTGYVKRVVGNVRVMPETPSSLSVAVPPIDPIPVVPVDSDVRDSLRQPPTRNQVSNPSDPLPATKSVSPYGSAVVF
jgi:type IV secretion system protein VirB1